jgi:hypothetical protein
MGGKSRYEIIGCGFIFVYTTIMKRGDRICSMLYTKKKTATPEERK